MTTTGYRKRKKILPKTHYLGLNSTKRSARAWFVASHLSPPLLEWLLPASGSAGEAKESLATKSSFFIIFFFSLLSQILQFRHDLVNKNFLPDSF